MSDTNLAPFSLEPEKEKLKVPQYIKDSLDSSQIKIVEAPLKDTCVFAVAGSGKTTTLKYKIATMIENGCKEEDMLLLTFTREAANEMKKRVEKLLDKKLDLTCGTFHSVALKLIATYGGYIGLSRLSILSENKANNLYYAAIQNVIQSNVRYESYKELISPQIGGIFYAVYGAKKSFQDTYSDRMNSIIKDTIRAKTLNPINYSVNKEEILSLLEAVDKEYNLLKYKYDTMDYNDMIEYLYLLLSDPKANEAITSKYKYVFVDEYQDINEMQYRVIKKLKDKKKHDNYLFVIGDRNQSIYQFRGSRDEYIEQFIRDYPDALNFTLNNNYRSAKDILKVAEEAVNMQNLIVTGKSKKVNIINKIDDKSNIEYLDIDGLDELMPALGYILEKAELKHNYSDMAVLGRTNSILRNIERAFIIMEIPYRMQTTSSFFDRVNINHILEIYLAAQTLKPIHMAQFAVLYKSITTEITDEIAEHITKLEESKLKNKRKPRLKKKLIPFKWLVDMVIQIRELDGVERIKFINKKVVTRILNYKKKTATLIELDDLEFELYKDCDLLIDLFNRYKSIEALVNLATRAQSKRNMENGVLITTMHKSKGLEWKHVVLYGINDTVMPLTKKPNVDVKLTDDERKLFYVAITRAMKNLFIVSDRSINPTKELKPSIFIKELLENPIASKLISSPDILNKEELKSNTNQGLMFEPLELESNPKIVKIIDITLDDIRNLDI